MIDVIRRNEAEFDVIKQNYSANSRENKQSPSLKFKWLQLDSNPEPLSS